MSSLQVLGRRIGRYWAMYAFGAVALTCVALVQVIAFTRLLGPAQFGRLAALQAFAGLITMLLIIGTMQGTMGRVLGTRGDDDDGGDDPDETIAVPKEGRSRTIATGTTIMLTGGALLVTISWILAPALSEWLTGTSHNAGLVRAMAVAGAAGAPFRLFLIFPRYTRRAGLFIFLEVGRGVLAMTVGVVLMVAGAGVQGAVIGVVAGDVCGVLFALVLSRREIDPRFSLNEAREIWRVGIRFAPVVIANYTMLTGDLLLLTSFASPSAVGRYRLAGGIARFAVFPIQVFLYAWGPLTKSPLQAAAEAESSRAEVGTLLLRYAVIAGTFIVLGAGLYSDWLVKIAPHSYASAGVLIPLVAAAYVLRTLYVIVYRISQFPAKRRVFIILYALAGFLFVGLSFALIPPLAGVGVGAARVTAFGLALLVMALASQRSENPLPIAWRPILLTLMSGVVGAFVGSLGGKLAPAGSLLGTIAFVALIIGTGAVPREHLRPLGGMVAAIKPARRRWRAEQRLRALSGEDVRLLRGAVRDHRPLEQLAAERGEDAGATLARLASIFNYLASPEDGERIDPLAASYALSYRLMAQHDRSGRRLMQEGVSPRSLDRVEEVVRLLRRIPSRRWEPYDPDGGSRSHVVPASVRD